MAGLYTYLTDLLLEDMWKLSSKFQSENSCSMSDLYRRFPNKNIIIYFLQQNKKLMIRYIVG